MNNQDIMDYEKAYKDALERARGHHGVALHYGKTEEVQELEHIFPELAESEDERTRKEIVAWMKGGNGHEFHENKDKWLAYLEKQKEQNPANNSKGVKDKFVARYITDELHDRVSDCWYDAAKEELRRIGYVITPKEEFDKLSHPAEWSEEDEKAMNDLYKFIGSDFITETIHENRWMPWKKAIENLRPQPHWKPSEEQMQDLDMAARMNEVTCPTLKSLYNDLKKLM